MMSNVIESAFDKSYDAAETLLKYIEREDCGVFEVQDMLDVSGSQQTVYEAIHTLKQLLSQQVIKEFVHKDNRHEVWGFVIHVNSYYKLKKYDGTFDARTPEKSDHDKYDKIIQEHCGDIMTKKRNKQNYVIIADRYSDRPVKFYI